VLAGQGIILSDGMNARIELPLKYDSI